MSEETNCSSPLSSLRPQVFITRKDGLPPSPDRIEPVTMHSFKPRGGLWTSTLRPDGRSHWEEWCEDNVDWYDGGRRFLLAPRPARLWHITRLRESLDGLFERFGALDPMYVQLSAKNPSLWRDEPISNTHEIDWAAFGAEYDGLHLSEPGLWAHRLDSMFVYGWDAESTLWLRWCFDSVEEIT